MESEEYYDKMMANREDYYPPYSREWHKHASSHLTCRKCFESELLDQECCAIYCMHGRPKKSRLTPLPHSRISVYVCDGCSGINTMSGEHLIDAITEYEPLKPGEH